MGELSRLIDVGKSTRLFDVVVAARWG